jgi:uncharacterized protein YukE
MSEQVIANPEELRSFARALDTFNDQLVQLVSGLSSRLAGLGESWRDREFTEFKDVLDQTVHHLNRFLGESERYVRFLQKKADPLDEYRHRKP